MTVKKIPSKIQAEKRVRDIIASRTRDEVNAEGRDTDNGRHINPPDQPKENLRAIEKKFSSYIGHAPVGIFVADEKGNFVEVNHEAGSMTGYSTKELLDMNFKMLIPPGEHEKGAAHFQQVVTKGSATGDFKFITKNGEERFWNVKAVKLNDTRFIAYTTDITGRIHAQQSMQQSEEKYRRIVETANEGIWAMDSRHIITYINRRMADMLEYKHEEMIGRPVHSFMFAEDLEDHGSKMRNRFKGMGDTYERRFKTSKGGEVWTIVSATALEDADGTFAGSFAMFTDITQRKKAEADLIIEKDRATMYLDNVEVIIVVLGSDHSIEMINRKGNQLLGYEAGELIGINWFENCIPDEDMKKTTEVFDLITKGIIEPVEYFENQVITKNGNKRLIAWHNTIIKNEKGVIVSVLSSGEDITDKRQAEKEKKHIEHQLAQAQKMEAIGNLAGGLAHDFNNVLGAMKGSLDIIETYLGQESLKNQEKIYKYLATAQSSSQRAADIIRQLLTFSRVEKQHLSPIDINLSLKHILEIAENSFPKSINLDFQFTETPLYILADPTQIEQVFLNICVNSSHAMTIMRQENEKEGGDLRVAVKIITADDDTVENHPEMVPGRTYVRTDISDTGVGINQENLKNIFEPFYTTKDRDQGTGLGLSMVYNIIKMHDGFIDVKSSPGRGTAMSVYIPRMEPRSPQHKSSGQAGIVKGSGTILIIDDEETIITVAEEFLNSFGYRTLQGYGALEGLDIYRRKHAGIDLVLLDLSMPIMSGYDVFMELKKINPRVKVLLSSGFAHDSRVQKILDAGAQGFIAKPYSRSILSQKVKEILT